MKELFEKLKKLDSETWDAIDFAIDIPDEEFESEFSQDSIEGCIQRAIMQRIPQGWACQQGCGNESVYRWAYIFRKGHKEVLGEADTPAKALLIAYVKALEAHHDR